LRVIAKRTLKEFWFKYPDCEQQLKAWHQEAEKESWGNPNIIKLKFPTSSILSDNRIVFNIKGNKYRLVIKINHDFQIIWIRFIGTHEQYDKIDAKTV